MKTLALFLLCLSLAACCRTTKPETHTGWVRTLANYNREIVFEDEQSGVFTCWFSFNESQPPLWKGMHATITFTRNGWHDEVCRLHSVKHLPPDAGN